MPRNSKNSRDEFSSSVRDTLAKRVGMRCSNPNCHKLTSGPRDDPSKQVNIGVAAHITAASPGGARYDPAMSSGQRSAIENGIWLCQNCAKLVDNDPDHYAVALLRKWKAEAEEAARQSVESSSQQPQSFAHLPAKHFRWSESLGCLCTDDHETIRHALAAGPLAESVPHEGVAHPRAEEFQDVLGRHLRIVGGPGSGKSFFLYRLLSSLREGVTRDSRGASFERHGRNGC